MGEKDEKSPEPNCQTNDQNCAPGTKLMEVNNASHVILEGQEGNEKRETWNKKIDFLLSVIGFAVDLANVWRFPFLCYKNGGGAFLIPYGLMLIFGGIPLFFMELALGQFYRTGAITCWGRVCPLFKGIGWAVVLIAFYTDFFYNVVIAWALHFFFASFTSTLPWDTCDNEWNTPDCYEGMLDPPPVDRYGCNATGTYITTAYVNGTLVNGAYVNGTYENGTCVNGSYFSGTNFDRTFTFNMTISNATKSKRVSPAHEYFERGMLQLHESGGIFAVGKINWQLMLCLLGVYIICYFSLWKGIHTSGKVVWFTALFPYVVLFILLIRGASLPGAGKGIEYYLTPDFTRLSKSAVWIDAATQVFFSLGPGFGVLLAFASYNEKHNNVYSICADRYMTWSQAEDALITSMVNCCTSFFSGFVIFMILGYMADRAQVDISEVATEGPGLVFEAYPMAIATLPGSTAWALIFFLMLLTLGLDSSFGGSEAIITALSDEFPILRKHREVFVAILFGGYFLVGLSFVSQGGAYVVTLMDKYAAGYSILFAVFFETIAVSWAYGVERFCDDIESMIGIRPGVYWKVTWRYIAPVFLLFIMIFGLVTYTPLEYDDTYTYPWAANLIGWCIALSSILCIPGYALFQMLRTPGTIQERFRFLITPEGDTVAEQEGVAYNDVKINGGNSAVGVHV